MNILTTDRLLIRAFIETDKAAMAAINADKDVMHYFPAPATREQSDALVDKIIQHQQDYGYSLYAVELKATGEMIGFVGLLYREKEELNIPGMPGTEIGWRLAAKHWNQGYATEAAKAVLQYAFTELVLPKVVSFTAIVNKPSQRIMEKIGLRHNPADDFDHPKLEPGHWLERHVLYRLTREAYHEQ